MSRPSTKGLSKWLSCLLAAAIVAMPLAAFAQTKIAYHSNKFKPTDDVKLGRQAAAEAEQQFPLLRDSEVTAYVEKVGQRLVASIPAEFQHSEFRYYFKVINASDINATLNLYSGLDKTIGIYGNVGIIGELERA